MFFIDSAEATVEQQERLTAMFESHLHPACQQERKDTQAVRRAAEASGTDLLDNAANKCVWCVTDTGVLVAQCRLNLTEIAGCAVFSLTVNRDFPKHLKEVLRASPELLARFETDFPILFSFFNKENRLMRKFARRNGFVPVADYEISPGVVYTNHCRLREYTGENE